MDDLKAEFKRLGVNGYLGDPEGADAYAYLRASTEQQVEEGSSFSRQLENLHKAAERDNLKIPFELVFFDDGFSGFEFEHRPALLKLRHELKSHPRARHLVIEDIDRLSRNADWQQGFLLEEFTRHKIEIHFFISPDSQLERYVRGYIAQEGMKKDLERMRMGNIHKAMDGRVTARIARYGYRLTDTRDTHYELHPLESKVVRLAYDKIIYQGWTLRKVAAYLNDQSLPPPKRSTVWGPNSLYTLLRSPVYKGVFYANRYYRIEVGKLPNGRPKTVQKERPPQEWIAVTVPAIVTSEEWQAAQDAMHRNAKLSSKQIQKRSWLLVGLVKCALCKNYSMVTIISGSSHQKKRKRYYVCVSRRIHAAKIAGTQCNSPAVWADVLEARVWEEIEKVIYDPSLVIRRLEAKVSEERAAHYEDQLAYISEQIKELDDEQEKFELAYERNIYSLDEFEEKMKNSRAQVAKLNKSHAAISAKLTETRSIEDKKRTVIRALASIRAQVEEAKANGQIPVEIPFDLKRKLLTLMVTVIRVDTIKRTFTIEGEIRGTFNLDEGIDFASACEWK